MYTIRKEVLKIDALEAAGLKVMVHIGFRKLERRGVVQAATSKVELCH